MILDGRQVAAKRRLVRVLLGQRLPRLGDLIDDQERRLWILGHAAKSKFATIAFPESRQLARVCPRLRKIPPQTCDQLVRFAQGGNRVVIAIVHMADFGKPHVGSGQLGERRRIVRRFVGLAAIELEGRFEQLAPQRLQAGHVEQRTLAHQREVLVDRRPRFCRLATAAARCC